MNKSKEQLALEYPQLQADIDLCYKYLFSICRGEVQCLSIPPRKENYDMQMSAAFDELKAYRAIGTPEQCAARVEVVRCGDCAKYLDSSCAMAYYPEHGEPMLPNKDDFCSYGERSE